MVVLERKLERDPPISLVQTVSIVSWQVSFGYIPICWLNLANLNR